MNDSLPYIPFYVRDFAADGKVEVMKTEQVGAYTLLLLKAWHETPPCTIPNDDRVLSIWTRLKPSVWAKVRAEVMACWTLDETTGRYFQKRLKAEYDKLVEARERRSKCGQKGNAKRWRGDRDATEATSHSDRNAIKMRSHAGMQMQMSPEGGPGETSPGWWETALTLWPRWTPAPEVRKSWESSLADADPKAILTALRKHLSQSPYPTPTLADVVKLLPKSLARHTDPAAEARSAERLANAAAKRAKREAAATGGAA